MYEEYEYGKKIKYFKQLYKRFISHSRIYKSNILVKNKDKDNNSSFTLDPYYKYRCCVVHTKGNICLKTALFTAFTTNKWCVQPLHH